MVSEALGPTRLSRTHNARVARCHHSHNNKCVIPLLRTVIFFCLPLDFEVIISLLVRAVCTVSHYVKTEQCVSCTYGKCGTGVYLSRSLVMTLLPPDFPKSDDRALRLNVMCVALHIIFEVKKTSTTVHNLYIHSGSCNIIRTISAILPKTLRWPLHLGLCM